ncbi:MAG: GDSL-type esterase/lipase family protein [Clostridia bacterium]|nr:GDSL-type esterase/lipase family protein [Clostridia bacterium]
MLNFSSRKSRKKRLLLLFISLIISIFSVSIIMISALGMLSIDRITWQGFADINKLEKLPAEISSLLSIDEEEAVNFIESITPPESGGKDLVNPNAPTTNPDPNSNGEIHDHILKETAPVGDDYFSDTLFVGDSRMVGLGMTQQNSDATFYAGVGLSVNQLNTKKIIKTDGEESYTVIEAVKNNPNKFKRIYLMFGLNELGWAYPKAFAVSFGDAIKQLAEICPDAEICIMGIMPISADKSVSIYPGSEANKRIREFNSLLLQLASDMNCWYLDSYNLFADEEGNLPDGFAADGIHMYSEQNRKLMSFISTHAFAS